MGLFSYGLKKEFETAVVNEPSVFEPLKFYCTCKCAHCNSCIALQTVTLKICVLKTKVTALSPTYKRMSNLWQNSGCVQPLYHTWSRGWLNFMHTLYLRQMSNFVLIQTPVYVFYTSNRMVTIHYHNSLFYSLTLLHSERPKLYTILACLSAIGLNRFMTMHNHFIPQTEQWLCTASNRMVTVYNRQFLPQTGWCIMHNLCIIPLSHRYRMVTAHPLYYTSNRIVIVHNLV